MKIAVVGDVHLVWDERDVRALDACGYDLILFVGDLAGYGAVGAIEVGRSIRELRTPTLVMPGNHDAVTLAQLAAEVLRTPRLRLAREALALGMHTRVQQLTAALAPVPLCGYSLHHFEALDLSVLAARPHTLGGERLGFRRYLAKRFGVQRMTESISKLCALFDQIPNDRRILVLAHCGPHGLGDKRTAIYGCDFLPTEGDWGDRDLSAALAYAREHGKRVLGVVAGHMHHRLRGGGERVWHVERDGLFHVNAARVPRKRRGPAGEERHHVRITLEGERAQVDAVWLPLPEREGT